MLVFKFGGASVKNAESVRNVAKILNASKEAYVLVIVSAMGKTTNKLETLLSCFMVDDEVGFNAAFHEIKDFHREIVDGLFPDGNENLGQQISTLYTELGQQFSQSRKDNESELYDAVVCYGELISTRIVNAYLNTSGTPSDWLDASTLVLTDDKFRSALVDMETTSVRIHAAVSERFVSKKTLVTQGFIGATADGRRTTLGREGSDYSGAIFSYALHAESLTIWKDVDGMYNADPNLFPEAQKINQVSYKEAIELSYYGASVIHPKTIQPLQNKNIPLYVKSFLDPDLSGTVIQKDASNTIPCYIVKKNQVLVSLSTRDFSFIAERHLSEIFSIYDGLDMKINIMQNSAVNFSALFDAKNFNEKRTIDSFASRYSLRYNSDLELITIRQFTPEIIKELTANREILLEQRTRETVRFVVR